MAFVFSEMNGKTARMTHKGCHACKSAAQWWSEVGSAAVAGASPIAKQDDAIRWQSLANVEDKNLEWKTRGNLSRLPG